MTLEEASTIIENKAEDGTVRSLIVIRSTSVIYDQSREVGSSQTITSCHCVPLKKCCHVTINVKRIL